MKKNSVLKAILLTILFVSVCTWLFKTIEFSGELSVSTDKIQVGFFDIFAYIVEVVRYFPYLILMTLSIGAFYGVAYRISGYRALLDKIVAKFKGKENILLVTVIAVLAIATSLTGFTLGLLFVFPFIISIVLLMGYNKLVAASTTVGAVAVGFIGNTVGKSVSYYLNYFLGTKYSSEIAVKIVLLLVGIIVLAYNVIMYAKKTKNETDSVNEFVPGQLTFKAPEVKKTEVKEENFDVKEAKKVNNKKKANNKKSSKTRANDSTSSSVKVVKKSKKASVWPFVLVFDLTFIIMLVAIFDWQNVLNATWPAKALTAVKDFSVGGFKVFSKLLGSSFANEFGAWDINFQVPAFIILMTILLGFVYGLKLDKFFEGMLDGIKKASKPVFYMVLCYVVLIIVTYHPFQLHFTKALLGLSSGLNVITMTIIALISSTFNIEPVYAAQSTLPYVLSVITDTSVYPIIGVIFQAAYGLMLLVAPTSAILVGTLVYLDIPYTQWLKHIWKVFVELLVIVIIIGFILVLL